MSLLLARNTKLIAESSVFLKHLKHTELHRKMDSVLIARKANRKGHLYPVIIGVRHDDLFLEAETESMR